MNNLSDNSKVSTTANAHAARPFPASLPDGSSVNISTEEGATEFLRKHPGNALSSLLKKITALRNGKKRLNQFKKKTIITHAETIRYLAQSDPSVFHEKNLQGRNPRLADVCD
mmetsp:Transcript_29181/g.70428  ORF Transcript_29181/g.70428 Transcript_29181/m.70428 type:complete len:113 (+) Transcript_29181:119-457(+)